jgi:hypothetical protein
MFSVMMAIIQLADHSQRREKVRGNRYDAVLEQLLGPAV